MDTNNEIVLSRAFCLMQDGTVHMFTVAGTMNEQGEFTPTFIHGYTEQERDVTKHDRKVVTGNANHMFRITVTSTSDGENELTVHERQPDGKFKEVPGAVMPTIGTVPRTKAWILKKMQDWAPGLTLVQKKELKKASEQPFNSCAEAFDKACDKAANKPTKKVGKSEPVSKAVRIPDPGKRTIKPSNTGSGVYLALEDLQPELQKHGLALLFASGKFQIVKAGKMVSAVS